METKQLSLFPELEETQMTPNISEQNRFSQAEWCFQFFDNEPVVFAWSKDESESGDLVLSLEPVDGASLVFSDKAMTFKIFSREMSEETRRRRDEQLSKTPENNQNDSQD